MMYSEKWSDLHSQNRYQPKYPSDTLVSFVFRNFKRGGRILDLGCGAGRHVLFLAQNGFETCGIDYSQNGINVTSERLKEFGLKADLKVGSVDKINYPASSFDGLICFGVLYYNDIETIENASKEIHRVLKDDAIAYIIIRSTEDYRYVNNKKLSKYVALIDENDNDKAANSENGMQMYFFDKDEVKRVFACFENIEINRIRVSHENDSYADDDFVVILKK